MKFIKMFDLSNGASAFAFLRSYSKKPVGFPICLYLLTSLDRVECFDLCLLGIHTFFFHLNDQT